MLYFEQCIVTLCCVASLFLDVEERRSASPKATASSRFRRGSASSRYSDEVGFSGY